MSRNVSRASNVDVDFALFEGIAEDVEANEREREEFFKVENKHEDLNVSAGLDVSISQNFHIDSSTPSKLFPPNRPYSSVSEYTNELEGKQGVDANENDVSTDQEDTSYMENSSKTGYVDDKKVEYKSEEEKTQTTADKNITLEQPPHQKSLSPTRENENKKVAELNNKNIDLTDNSSMGSTKENTDKNHDSELTHTDTDVLITHECNSQPDFPENNSGATSRSSSPDNNSKDTTISLSSNGDSRNSYQSNSSPRRESFTSVSSSSSDCERGELAKTDDEGNIIGIKDTKFIEYEDNESHKNYEKSCIDEDDNINMKYTQVIEDNQKPDDEETTKRKDSTSNNEQQHEMNDNGEEDTEKENYADNNENDESIEKLNEVDAEEESCEKEKNAAVEDAEEEGNETETKKKNEKSGDGKGDYDETGDRRYHLRELEIISDDEYDNVNIQEIRQARVDLNAFTKNFDNFVNIISELEKESPKEVEEMEREKTIRFDLGSLEGSRPVSSSKTQEILAEEKTKGTKGKLKVILPSAHDEDNGEENDIEQKQHDIAVVISCGMCNEKIYDEYTLPNLEEIFSEGEKTCAKCYSEKNIESNYLANSIDGDTYTYSDRYPEDSDYDSDRKVEEETFLSKPIGKKKKKKKRPKKSEQKAEIDRIKKQVKPKLAVGFKETDDKKLLDWLNEKAKTEKKKKRQERREEKEKLNEKKKKQKEEEERAKLARQKTEEWNAKKLKEIREKKKNISVSLRADKSKPIIHNQNRSQIQQSTKPTTPPALVRNVSKAAIQKKTKKVKPESKQQYQRQQKNRMEVTSPPPLDISEENSFEQFRQDYLNNKEAPQGFTSIETFVETVIQDAVEEMERDIRVKQTRLKRPKSHVHFNGAVETKYIPSKPKSANPASRLARATNSSRAHRATSATNDADRKAANRRLLRSKTYDEWFEEKKRRQDLKTKEQEINEYYDRLEEKLILLEKERRKALLGVRTNNWTNEKLPDLSTRPEPQGSELQYNIER